MGLFWTRNTNIVFNPAFQLRDAYGKVVDTVVHVTTAKQELIIDRNLTWLFSRNLDAVERCVKNDLNNICHTINIEVRDKLKWLR